MHRTIRRAAADSTNCKARRTVGRKAPRTRPRRLQTNPQSALESRRTRAPDQCQPPRECVRLRDRGSALSRSTTLAPIVRVIGGRDAIGGEDGNGRATQSRGDRAVRGAGLRGRPRHAAVDCARRARSVHTVRSWKPRRGLVFCSRRTRMTISRPPTVTRSTPRALLDLLAASFVRSSCFSVTANSGEISSVASGSPSFVGTSTPALAATARRGGSGRGGTWRGSRRPRRSSPG